MLQHEKVMFSSIPNMSSSFLDPDYFSGAFPLSCRCAPEIHPLRRLLFLFLQHKVLLQQFNTGDERAQKRQPIRGSDEGETLPTSQDCLGYLNKIFPWELSPWIHRTAFGGCPFAFQLFTFLDSVPGAEVLIRSSLILPLSHYHLSLQEQKDLRDQL